MYKIVPEPYMDEIFHIDQARRFCVLNLTLVYDSYLIISYSTNTIVLFYFNVIGYLRRHHMRMHNFYR